MIDIEGIKDIKDATVEEKLEVIANFYGYETQSRNCIEEMAELTQAINKLWRKQNIEKTMDDTLQTEKENIVEEMADVVIMLKQMQYLLSVPDEVLNKKTMEKVDRQLQRMVTTFDVVLKQTVTQMKQKQENIDMYELIERLKDYESTGIPPETVIEYKKFEDEIVSKNMSFNHVLELVQVESALMKMFNGYLSTKDITKAFIEFHEENFKNEQTARAIILTNAEAVRYEKLKEEEKNGLILHIPCKIGDDVFYLSPTYEIIRKGKVTGFKTDGEMYAELDNGCVFMFSEFGISVFTDREQAIDARSEKMEW